MSLIASIFGNATSAVAADTTTTTFASTASGSSDSTIKTAKVSRSAKSKKVAAASDAAKLSSLFDTSLNRLPDRPKYNQYSSNNNDNNNNNNGNLIIYPDTHVVEGTDRSIRSTRLGKNEKVCNNNNSNSQTETLDVTKKRKRQDNTTPMVRPNDDNEEKAQNKIITRNGNKVDEEGNKNDNKKTKKKEQRTQKNAASADDGEEKMAKDEESNTTTKNLSIIHPDSGANTIASATNIESGGVTRVDGDKKIAEEAIATSQQEEVIVDSRSDENTGKMDADSSDRTIFVGNLPITTTRKSLERMFRSCGQVESCRLRSLPVTANVKLPPDRAGDDRLMKKVSAITQPLDSSKKNTVQGYVVFQHAASVERALQLNNSLVNVAEGEKKQQQVRIRVDTANPTVDASRSVFVGNLPYHADETSLQIHFVKGCGLSVDDVENVRIVRDPITFQCRGFGYVLFRNKTMVATALARMHESLYQRRSLRVLVCGKRFKGEQRRRRQLLQEQEQPQREKLTSPKLRPAKEEGENINTSSVAALRRILSKERGAGKKNTNSSHKRKRGGTPSLSSSSVAKKTGVSKRAVAQAKAGKVVKKLQKRLHKGMGKTKR